MGLGGFAGVHYGYNRISRDRSSWSWFHPLSLRSYSNVKAMGYVLIFLAYLSIIYSVGRTVETLRGDRDWEEKFRDIFGYVLLLIFSVLWLLERAGILPF
ncbi:MAG TPA: hypothetical protein DIC64_04350 [Alphaproteobacteria bacterium]|nr:hypothetical protein [Alphaproteobacteria bacterium]